MQSDISTVQHPEDGSSMTEARKFLFDRSFDPVEPQEEIADEEEEVAEEEAAPTFSEEEMQAAREAAYAQGKQEGVAEAAAATEQEILAVLEQVLAQFGELFKAEAEGQSELTEDTVAAAIGIVRKLFPTLNERQAQAEVERIVLTAMERILEDPRVVVFVAPEMVAPLQERLEPLAAQAAYKGDVDVVANEEIEKGDCRVEWTGGGGSRLTDELWREIDEIIERNLSGAGDQSKVDSPDEAETEAAAETDAGDAIIDTGDESTEAAADEESDSLDTPEPDDTVDADADAAAGDSPELAAAADDDDSAPEAVETAAEADTDTDTEAAPAASEDRAETPTEPPAEGLSGATEPDDDATDPGAT